MEKTKSKPIVIYFFFLIMNMILHKNDSFDWNKFDIMHLVFRYKVYSD